MEPRKALATSALAVAGLLATAVAASAGTIVVSPTNPSGWAALSTTCGNTLTSTQRFVTGPPPAPAGTGSREFVIGANADSVEQYRQDGYSGVDISALTELSYSTFVMSPPPLPPPGSAPYLILAVDQDGDNDFDAASADEHVVFEPGRQTAPVVAGLWQSWNTLPGDWWGENTGPNTEFPLTGDNSYATTHPQAQIINTPQGGGLVVGTGCGITGAFVGEWEGFAGNVDALTIKANGIPDPTYDFETASPPPPGEEPPPQPPPSPEPPPPGTADLSIAKTAGPDPVEVGGTLTYRIAVTNFGPEASTATVEDTLPGNVSLVSASSTRGTCSGTQVVTCSLGELARDSSASIDIVVRPTRTGTIENRATVTGTTTDSFTGNNSATATSRVADERPPRVVLRGSRTCELIADRACLLDVESNEHGTAAATGTVSFRGPAASARFKFRRVRRSLRAGSDRELRLAVSGRARRRIGLALVAKRRVRANIRVVVKDRAGNVRTVRRRLRIVG